MTIPVRPLTLIWTPTWYGAKRKGPEVGPTTLQKAGLPDMLASSASPRSITDVRAHVFPETHVAKNSAHRHFVDEISDTAISVHSLAMQAFSCDHDVLCIGGDHSGSIGMLTAVAAYARNKDEHTLVIYFDNHGDAHTPATSKTNRIYGQTITTAMGLGAPEFVEKGLPCLLGPRNILHIGGGDIEKAELEFFSHHKILTLKLCEIMRWHHKERAERIVQFIAKTLVGVTRIHVEFDLDVLSATSAPQVLLKNTLGLPLSTVLPAIHFLSSTNKVRSASIMECSAQQIGCATTQSAIKLARSLFP